MPLSGSLRVWAPCTSPRLSSAEHSGCRAGAWMRGTYSSDRVHFPGAWSLQNKHNPWDPPSSLFLPCLVPQMLPQPQPIPRPAPEDLEEGGVYGSPSLGTLLSLSSIPWEGTEGAILERAPKGLCESFLSGNSMPWGSLRGDGWWVEPQMAVRAPDGPGHRMALPCLKNPFAPAHLSLWTFSEATFSLPLLQELLSDFLYQSAVAA